MPPDTLPELTRRCGAADCSRPYRAAGYCNLHYLRVRRNGSTEPVRVRREGCAIKGCDRDHFGLGYCQGHYTRFRKSGDPGPVELAPFRPGHGYINAKGYRVLGDGRLEHRVVMENMLDRPMLTTEQVHHRNGDRLDNRPANLELWIVSQPSGQRVEDALDHALSIVRRYAPHLIIREDTLA